MEKVKVKEGILEGTPGEGCTVFRGIPYAQPPVGPLRFRAPQPPQPWEGVRPAHQFSRRAWQMVQTGFYEKEFFSNPAFMPAMDEDCLYLNIWTPAKSPTDKLPAAFWIHGGAFINGFGSEMEFDGEAFAKRGVILVTVNYRLGAFGFLASPEITQENNGIVGNMGILDQIAALRWVKENIAAFGGDPDRITIFGQSAGAISCQTLLSSPMTKGLFSGAILQSGGGYRGILLRDHTPEEAYAVGAEFYQRCGAANLAELRTLPAEKLMEAAQSMFAEMAGRGLPFWPVVDGHVMQAGYNASIEQGLIHNVPIMAGSTSSDLGASPDTAKRSGADPLSRGCIDLSLALESLGRKPAFVYYFNQVPQGDDAGAFHSSELWYVFGTLDRSWRPKTPADYLVSGALADYWTNFIKTGDPNGANLPAWRVCSSADPYVQVLDEKTIAPA